MTRSFFATSAAALAVLSAAAAHAQTHRLVVVSETLTYQTQDVASPAGASKMLKRIELAALRLCATNSPASSPTGRLTMACRRAAVSRAVATLDAPLVTAAYAARRPAVAIAAR